jgi:hypothetical protein
MNIFFLIVIRYLFFNHNLLVKSLQNDTLYSTMNENCLFLYLISTWVLSICKWSSNYFLQLCMVIIYQLALSQDAILNTSIKRKEKFQFIKVDSQLCRFNRCEHIIDRLVKCMSISLLLHFNTWLMGPQHHNILFNSQHSGKVLHVDLAFTSKSFGNLSWNLNFMYFLTKLPTFFIRFPKSHCHFQTNVAQCNSEFK